MSQRPGLDPVLQAEMGLMTLNGEPEGDPLRHPLSLTDPYTGMQAATAICAALVRQQTGGRGCHIDLSLMGGAMAMLGNMGTYAMATGHNPPRMGNGFPTVAPVGATRLSREGRAKRHKAWQTASVARRRRGRAASAGYTRCHARA